MSFFDTTAADAALIVAEVGRTVTFRSADVKAMVSPQGVALDLAAGGFSETGAIRVKFLRAAYSSQPPADGERIVFAGKTYRIDSVTPSQLSPWFEVNASTLTS